MDLFKTLSTLADLPGPSGREGTLARAAGELLMPLADHVWIDRLQNVIGVKYCGKQNAKRLLLDAHLDEVALMVTGIEEGFLRFRTVGIDPRVLPGREVMVQTDPPMFGVITSSPPHLTTGEERDKAIPVDELYVDIGLSQEEAEETVPIGTVMTYRERCFPLGEKQVCGKTMDDRSCFCVLLQTLELLQDTDLDLDVYVLGSTCEETGGSGAAAATFGINPDYAIAVDVTFGCQPDVSKSESLPMGGGPAIATGPNITRWMERRLKDCAKKESIPYSVEVISGSSGTNGWEMQISREGVATAIVGLPQKYMHTPLEVIHREDVENTARLLAAFAKNLGEEAPK